MDRGYRKKKLIKKGYIEKRKMEKRYITKKFLKKNIKIYTKYIKKKSNI